METAQDAPLNLMGVVNVCGCVLWLWPWYLMALRKSWSLCNTVQQCLVKGSAENSVLPVEDSLVPKYLHGFPKM